jgi:hypothetical protein
MREALQPSRVWVISKCIRGVVHASDAMALKADQQLSSKLPLAPLNRSAVSFSDGVVYTAATDTMVPAPEFNGSCYRYLDQPSTASARPTPAFSSFCAANQIPQPLMCSALGRLLHAPSSVPRSVICVHVPQQHDTDLDVDCVLGCVIPKAYWLWMAQPKHMLQRITSAHQASKRVLVADVRGWDYANVSKLLQAVHHHRAATKLHAVIITSPGRPMSEEALDIVLVQVTRQLMIDKEQITQESAAILFKSNQQFLEKELWRMADGLSSLF